MTIADTHTHMRAKKGKKMNEYRTDNNNETPNKRNPTSSDNMRI